MKVRMIVGTLVLALLTAVAAGLGQAQGPGVENRPQPGRAADPAGAADASQQQAGPTIPYAGRLEKGAGQPVAEGTYDFTFALYPAETGGEPLWSELQDGVVVKGGSFSVSLGSVTPIPPAVLDGRPLWLAVGVRGPGEAGFTALTPRQRVSAAAPASPAANAACPHDHLGEQWSGDSGPGGNGLRVENTRADGYGVTGVAHNGSNASGVLGWSVSGNGVEGSSDNGTGVWAHSTNGSGLFAHSDNSHSIYVDGSGSAGVYVSSAGTSGVYVASATYAGVAVYSAGMMGMWIHSAAQDGILVDTAGWDGVHVTGPVGGVYYGSGKKGDEDFAVLNTGEVRSKVGFAAPSHGFAENMAVEGAQTDYEPGDVLVASSTGKGAVALSSSAYSRAVIGVYATSPAYVGGQPVSKDQPAGDVPVTIMGMVLCKVSAENGPVRPGDLLVTSATPGHAMRADQAPPGTILGKALEALDSGTGVILVLVTLQ
jgi:hypothetical protein